MWIHRDRLAKVREFPMHGWTDMHFRRMAVSPVSFAFSFFWIVKSSDIAWVIDAFRV